MSLPNVPVPKDVLENLKCAQCSWYLSVPPITHNRQNELICGRCKVTKGCCRVTAFETVAKLLLFPCSYANAGCSKQELPWDLVKVHEDSCEHRFHACPMDVLASCTWRGNWTMLAEHFRETHNHLVNFDSFCVNLNQSICEINVMSLRGHVFLVHIFINTKEDTMEVGVQHVGQLEAPEKCSYKLKFRKIDSDCEKNTMAFEDEVASGYDWTRSLNNMSQLNIHSIKDLLKAPEIACKIEIFIGAAQLQPANKIEGSSPKPSQDKGPINHIKGLDLDMLGDLECPICMEFMVPPIFVCQSGHSVCGECKKQLQLCPTCRISLGSTRNFLLERLTTHINYPCKYKNYGCKFVGNSLDLNDHNKKCELKASECPLKEPESCNWKGAPANLLEHLLLKHEGKTWNGRGRTILRDLTSRTLADFYILNYQYQLFKISCKHSLKAAGAISWSFQQIGLPAGGVSPYMFKVEFLGPPNSRREFKIDSQCQGETAYKEIFNNTLTIPNCLLSPFVSSAGVLHFRYELQRM